MIAAAFKTTISSAPLSLRSCDEDLEKSEVCALDSRVSYRLFGSGKGVSAGPCLPLLRDLVEARSVLIRLEFLLESPLECLLGGLLGMLKIVSLHWVVRRDYGIQE